MSIVDQLDDRQAAALNRMRAMIAEALYQLPPWHIPRFHYVERPRRRWLTASEVTWRVRHAWWALLGRCHEEYE